LTYSVNPSNLPHVILSYRDKRTRTFATGNEVAQFRAFAEQAYKRLRILEAATSLTDLRGLPSNRLEALRGKRTGQWSIRINQRWRICFEWSEDGPGAENVKIVDYHDE
jgi:proteic killer suppression protein